MGVNEGLLVDEIDPTFIAPTMTAIHHCLSVLNAFQFRVLPVVGPGGTAHHIHNTRIINQVVNYLSADVSLHLNASCHSFLPEVEA
jgi:hypothetical protein